VTGGDRRRRDLLFTLLDAPFGHSAEQIEALRQGQERCLSGSG
jgi:hypothetical protein